MADESDHQMASSLIVLGMAGSGKTTFVQKLANSSQLQFADWPRASLCGSISSRF